MWAFSKIAFISSDRALVKAAEAEAVRVGIQVCGTDRLDELTLTAEIRGGLLFVGNTAYADLKDLQRDYLYVPQVFQNVGSSSSYRVALAEIIAQQVLQRRIQMADIDCHFLSNLDAEMNTVYEKYTGAVQFEDYEWESIAPSDPLKRFFSSQRGGIYLYLMPTESSVLLRGAAVYYYHAAYGKVNAFGGRDKLEHWFSNVRAMLCQLHTVLCDYDNNSAAAKRLLLGVTDNLRNLILIFLNYELMRGRIAESFFWDEHSAANDPRYTPLTQMVREYQRILETLVFNGEADLTSLCQSLCKMIEELLKISEINRVRVRKEPLEWGLYKCFGPLPRENDHYFENYLTLSHCLKKLPESPQQLQNFVGIMSGGLELPFICQRLRRDVNVCLVYQNLGTYFDRQSQSVARVCPCMSMPETAKEQCGCDTIVLDDNITCGITAQHVINELVYNGFSVKGLWCIKHPDIGRAAQVIHYGHCINFDAIGSGLVDGLLFPASYTKIPEDRNIDGYFLNEFGVYSATVDVFLRGLYKNGGFLAGSETDIFAGHNRPCEQDLLIDANA